MDAARASGDGQAVELVEGDVGDDIAYWAGPLECSNQSGVGSWAVAVVTRQRRVATRIRPAHPNLAQSPSLPPFPSSPLPTTFLPPAMHAGATVH